MAAPVDSPETILTLIRGAAEGKEEERSLFCVRYLPLVRSYLATRWRETPWIDCLDDGVQEAFLECLRESGALGSFDPRRPGGFRSFLYGVLRNVALRLERSQGRRLAHENALESLPLSDLPGAEGPLSRFFEREWARTVMQQARQSMRSRALDQGEPALRRLEILRLRFEEGLPIREIATRWQEEPATVHRAYRKARMEFRAGLEEAVAYHGNGSPEEIDRECRKLLDALGP